MVKMLFQLWQARPVDRTWRQQSNRRKMNAAQGPRLALLSMTLDAPKLLSDETSQRRTFRASPTTQALERTCFFRTKRYRKDWLNWLSRGIAWIEAIVPIRYKKNDYHCNESSAWDSKKSANAGKLMSTTCWRWVRGHARTHTANSMLGNEHTLNARNETQTMPAISHSFVCQRHIANWSWSHIWCECVHCRHETCERRMKGSFNLKFSQTAFKHLPFCWKYTRALAASQSNSIEYISFTMNYWVLNTWRCYGMYTLCVASIHTWPTCLHVWLQWRVDCVTCDWNVLNQIGNALWMCVCLRTR